MQRLAQAGFRKDFIRAAILPDWWEADCSSNPDVLPDIEIRVARFLGQPIGDIRNPELRLSAPTYAGAQLRQIRDIDRSRLGPAIHTALAVAAAASRSVKPTIPPPSTPPPDAIEWRREILGSAKSATLERLLRGLLGRGIPVIPLQCMPTPKFQGLACIVKDRPVIVIGYQYDDPGRVAHLICHEVGHIAGGDCEQGNLVVDADEEVRDNSRMERAADLFALRVLTGRDEVPELEAQDFKALAETAHQIESQTGTDASIVIATWAKRTRQYAMATLALQALYRSQGAQRLILEYLERFLDLESASESDRNLLRCALGGGEQNGTAD